MIKGNGITQAKWSLWLFENDASVDFISHLEKPILFHKIKLKSKEVNKLQKKKKKKRNINLKVTDSQQVDLAFGGTLRKSNKVLSELQLLVIIYVSINSHFHQLKKLHLQQETFHLAQFSSTSSIPMNLQHFHRISMDANLAMPSYTVKALRWNREGTYCMWKFLRWKSL